MIDSQRGAKRRVGYNHLISNKRKWNNCVIKNHQQTLLDFADFAWLEQPEGNLMEAISRVWYNGSYTTAAKPIKTLELHYTMIQVLINIYILGNSAPCPKNTFKCQNLSLISIGNQVSEHFFQVRIIYKQAPPPPPPPSP